MNQVDQAFNAVPEPIQFPDHEGIGFAQVGQALLPRSSFLDLSRTACDKRKLPLA